MTDEARLQRYIARFHKRYQVVPSGCWIWMKSLNKDGYGQTWFEGTNHPAHRVAYRLFVGPIPEGLFVLHSCDTPACVNPAHLRAGTQLENIADAYTRGRKDDRGSSNGWSKLTDAQVLEIRERWRRGETQTSLARRFPVCQSHISDIVNRLVWRHL